MTKETYNTAELEKIKNAISEKLESVFDLLHNDKEFGNNATGFNNPFISLTEQRLENSDYAVRLINIIAKKNADINAKFLHRREVSMFAANITTPLHNAAFRGDANIVRALLESGAEVNIQNGVEDTPLHYAYSNNNHGSEVAKLLIESGADKSLQNRDGNTPLHIAISAPGLDMELYKQDFAFNIRNEDGKTPLLIYVQNNVDDNNTRKAKVSFMISNGADPFLKDKKGNNVFDYIKQNINLPLKLSNFFETLEKDLTSLRELQSRLSGLNIKITTPVLNMLGSASLPSSQVSSSVLTPPTITKL